MDNIENNTKKYITSLLTSSPLVLTVPQLCKEYTNTIGEPIPYHRLGYNSLEHFLRSISDTVIVRGSGPNAEVLPVISQKSAHVYNLVSHQKVSKPKRSQFSRPLNRVMRYVPPPKPAKLRPFHVDPKPAQVKNRIYYPPVNECPSASSSSSHQSTQSLDYVTYNNKVQTEQLPKKSVEVRLASAPKTSSPISNCRVEPVADTNKPAEGKKLEEKPKPENDLRCTTDDTSTSKKCTNVKNLLKRLTPDKGRLGTEQVENNIPYNVRNNLKRLIDECPEGIWCADIPEKYRRMFRQELNYQELGFRSLIDLCVCLSSIFHYVRPSTEDFKLYARNRPLPDCAETKFTVASYNFDSAEVQSGALPNIDWADVDMFLPKDIFKPGEEISRSFIPREMADYDLDIDVVVGEIYDLSKFWIYLQDSLLDQLMDNMQDFYRNHALDYQIPQHLIKEGLYCVQIIFGEYHRALIVDAMPEVEDTVRVIFIDYGTMTKVPMKGLCFLREEFAKLPAQAIRCRLANVVPLEEGIPWSKEASKAFRKMVANRDMSIKISHINWEDQFLEIYLADVTDEDNVFYINDRLVEEGFARYPNQEPKPSCVDPIYTPIVKFIHLFPTFLELEHGLAPSTAEMEIFNDCEVPINFCYPQYFFVDYSFEEKIIEAAEDFHEKNCIKGKQRTPDRFFYDLARFKSPMPDMSIFGELADEITAFLNETSSESTHSQNGDEDLVVSEEEDFHSMLEVMTEKFKYLSTKEEETVNVLKRDLLMTEDIMNDINIMCKFEDEVSAENRRADTGFSCESQIGDVKGESDVFEEICSPQALERQLWTINETVEKVEAADWLEYRNESDDMSDEDLERSQMLFSNRPPSNSFFHNQCSPEAETGSSNISPKSERSLPIKNADCDLQQPDVWLRPINFSFLTANNATPDYMSPDTETSAHEPRDDVYNYFNASYDRRCDRDDPKGPEALFSNVLGSPSGSSVENNEEITARDVISTNPFLKDSNAVSDTSTDLPADLQLNPTNPFLTFLSSKSEKGSSDSSQGSSTSTTYESPILEVQTTTHSWSNFDDISPETISQLGKALSCKSGSSNSFRTSDDRNSCSIATQTFDEQNRTTASPPPTRPPPQGNPYPCYYPPQPAFPYAYPNWSLGCANPYYGARFGGYPPQYSPMVPYRPPPPPGLNPPPGFAPIETNAVMPVAYRNHMVDPSYRPRPLPYGWTRMPPQQGAAVQFNGTSRTTSLSSVSVSVVNEKDFYDVYNAHLRTQVEDGGGK